MAIITLNNISFSYEKNHSIINKLSGVFSSDKCTAIIGPSGCGKTTLLHLISQWIKPYEGIICVERDPTIKRPLFRYVYSSAMLISELTVEENIFLDRSKNYENIALFKNLLESFDLTEYAQAWPQTLSSGQQQRVGVMRALLGDAAYLLADEPTSHLDPIRAFDLMKMLTAHLKATSRGMICVTHDRNLLPLFDYTVDLTKDN